MTKALRTDLFREIQKSKARFLSLFFIVALGVAFFAGVRSSEPDMKLSLDTYYKEQNYMDIRVLSTYGLTQKDLTDIRQMEGVSLAEGVKTTDVLCRLEDTEAILKLISFTGDINRVVVQEGRMPEDIGECFLDASMAKNLDVKVGDVLQVHLPHTADDISKQLKTVSFTVTGIGLSPAYLELDRGSSSLGDGRTDYFLMITPDNFESEIFSEIYVTLEEASKFQTGSQAYQAVVDEIKERIEEKVSDAACIRRWDEVKQQALCEGFAGEDYASAKEEAYQEALPKAKEEAYEQGYEQAYEKMWNTSYEEAIAKAKEEAYKKAKEEAYQQGYDELYQQLLQVFLNQGIDRDSAIKLMEGNRDDFEKKFDVTFQEQILPELEQKFEGSWNTEGVQAFTEEFRKKFEESFVTEYQEAFEKKWQEKYLAEFDKTFLEEFDQEFAKEVENKLEEQGYPEWYVLDRNSISACVEYSQDAERIGKIGKVFPLLFFLVAALVSMTTMTRMIEDERCQIGTLKSLGYSGVSIAMKYLVYAAIATLGGSLVGTLIGEKIFPFVILNSYGMLYVGLPVHAMPYHLSYALLATGLAFLCILGGCCAICLRATISRPAALMRPPTPKAGKRIWLEYLSPIWKRMTFTQKACARSMFRYKKRLFMTVFGIGGCMSLLLVGFGLRDSILDIALYQYSEIFTYDVSVTINTQSDEEAKKELEETIKEYPSVTDTMKLRMEYMDVSSLENKHQVFLYVPEDVQTSQSFLVMRERVGKQSVPFADEEGTVSINEKLADILNVSVGDTIYLHPDETTTYEVKVASVFENYIQHYVCMSEKTYEKIFGKQVEYQTIWAKSSEHSAAYEKQLSEKILELSGCSGIAAISELQHDIDEMLRSLNLVIVVLIVSAAMLALVVLYNLNNINFMERKRELATIKVLGFFDHEVAAYVYRDSVFLTIFGCILGVVLGKILHAFVIQTVEIEVMMFGRSIQWLSFAYSILLTIFFSVMVNYLMYFRLKKIDMVESLKSVE